MEKNRRDKRGQLSGILAAFIIVAAVLILLVLLIFVFGTLNTSLEGTKVSHTVTNESNAWVNGTNYSVAGRTVTGSPRDFASVLVLGDWNQTNGSQSGIQNTPTGYNVTIAAANYSLTDTGILFNTTAYNFPNVSITYTYNNDSASIAAVNTAQNSTSNAVPLIGILFVVLAIGAIIGVLVTSFMGKKRRA